MARPADVLIIGGGPAGLAAAINLAGAGFDVVLCERGRLPRLRPCGEGLMPTGVGHLERMGVQPSISQPFAGIRYIAPDGQVAAARFREGSGLGIRRRRLSAALEQRTRDYPNLELRQGVRAIPLLRTPDGVLVRAGDEEICCRLLIGADGRRSPVRRWAGLEREGRRHWRWGTRRHFACPPWSDHVEVYWSRQGVEAYITPTGPEEVNVALLWTRGQADGIEGGDALFDSLLANFPALQMRLRTADAIDSVATTGPLQQRVRAPVADGVLLLGDASGYTDAITGEGLSLAFAQAAFLPTVAGEALAAGDGLVPRAALAAYERVWQGLGRPAAQLAEAALLLSRYPGLSNWSTRALARDPGLFQHLLSANMGLATLWRPAMLGRAAIALARTAGRK